MSRTYTDAELEAVASILLDDYATEYSAGHLSWRDFDGPAARILGAVAPAIVRRAKAEALREAADLIEETPWEVFSSEGPLDGSDDRTWLHGTDCAIRFATRLTRLRADEI